MDISATACRLEIAFKFIAPINPVDYGEPELVEPLGRGSSMTLTIDEGNQRSVYEMLAAFNEVDRLKNVNGLLFLVEFADDHWQLVRRYDPRVDWLGIQEARRLEAEYDQSQRNTPGNPP